MSSRTPNGTNLNGRSIKEGVALTCVKHITQSKMPHENPRTESHGTNQNQMPSAKYNLGMASIAK